MGSPLEMDVAFRRRKAAAGGAGSLRPDETLAPKQGHVRTASGPIPPVAEFLKPQVSLSLRLPLTAAATISDNVVQSGDEEREAGPDRTAHGPAPPRKPTFATRVAKIQRKTFYLQ